MATPIDDGGPAFPGESGEHGYGPFKPIFAPDGEKRWIALNQGMTLRDYFASKESLIEFDHPEANISKPMMEALAGEEQPENGWGGDLIAMFRFEAKWRAALKYIRADAMIAARNGKEGQPS